MTQQPIPFTNQQASSSDSLGGASPAAHNVISDQAMVRRRPGLRTYSGAPAAAIDANGLEGIYITLDGRLWAVAGNGAASSSGLDRPIYSISAGGAIAIGGGLAPNGLSGTKRPTFAETEMLLVVAGGQYIQKVELATLVSDRLGGDPPQSTHVVANSSRLLANDFTVDKTKVRFSSVALGTTTYAGNEIWDPTAGNGGYVTAEARPDPVVAIYENTNEVFVWGTTTLQVFAPDPTLVYGSVAVEENGNGAPYSVLKIDQQFAWIDQAKRIVIGNGRGQQIISTPIQLELNQIALEGAHAFRFLEGPLDAMCWRFPADGRTYSFQKGAGWSQWSGIGRSSFPVTCMAVDPNTNAHVVGLEDGRIAELSMDADDDLGTPIDAYIQTGYVNRGTDNRKNCVAVRITLRRGTTSSTSATLGPLGWLKWRDRPGPWTGEIPIDFGVSGETDPVVEFRSLGVYRRREWMFQFTSSEQLTLVSAVEEFEILEN